MQFSIRYDLRNPATSKRSFADFYAQFLDQVAWADEHGFASVALSEHHFSPDGYLPSLFVMAGAIAARTKKMRISLGLVLLPLKHPVQVAEDAAIVDILSNGRLNLILGAGYRQEEYDGYGIPMTERPSRMAEGIQIIRKCWTEEGFDFTGKYWQLKGVNVIPKPVQKPHPRIIMGGTTPTAGRIAARYADAFGPDMPSAMQAYRDEMRKLGKDPGPEVAPLPADGRAPGLFLHCAKDPEKAWKQIAPYAVYESSMYGIWAEGVRPTAYTARATPEQLRANNTYGVMTPEQIVALGKRMEAARPGGASLGFHPLMGGMPHELGQESLELVVKEVMPHFK